VPNHGYTSNGTGQLAWVPVDTHAAVGVAQATQTFVCRHFLAKLKWAHHDISPMTPAKAKPCGKG